MRYIRDSICTGHTSVYISVPAGKKDKKYLIKNQSNLYESQYLKKTWTGGGGEKGVFPPTKDIGTRVGD